jgi:ABC-type nitrate/sulfonate/bicarbonate transport system substrate-binding protein
VIFMGAAKYAEERGPDLAKYNGSTWAYTAEGAVSQVFMIKAAQAAGLDWAKQGHLAVGTVDAFIPTLRQGRADIVTMDAKSAAQTMKLGIGYPVFNTMEPDRVEGIWGQQLGLPMVTTRQMVDQDPQLVQDVSDAVREGLVAIQRNSNDAAAVLALMPKQFQEVNKDDFAIQWQLFRAAFAVDGTFSDRALKDTITFAVQTGALKEAQATSVDVAKHFDNRFASKSVAALPSSR